ncbi:MAG TPA: hypothetical protein VHW43_08250, partial [Puia sp.]|nr:hypothetical protein [Puia sp.]
PTKIPTPNRRKIGSRKQLKPQKDTPSGWTGKKCRAFFNIQKQSHAATRIRLHRQLRKIQGTYKKQSQHIADCGRNWGRRTHYQKNRLRP